MLKEEQLEELCMIIIANSGEGKSLAYQAVDSAKKGDFATADSLYEKSLEAMKNAHSAHSQLLKYDALGEVEQNALSVHAQCHIMCSIVAQETSKQVIDLYKEIKK